jgi:hypothetical protein
MNPVFTLAFSLALIVQSQGSLRQKYGSAMRESYLVRPGILVTVMYNKDKEVCEMLIEPQPPSTLIKSSDVKLESKVLNEIIDELAPKAERGKHLLSSFLNLTCLPRNDCAGTDETYERVVIYRNGGVNAHRYATIQWKKPGCGN